MARLVRIHLGCGNKIWPGFINVDLCDEADIKANVKDLSCFESNFADEIHAIHLFEHLHRMEVIDILKEWRRVLKPNGTLILEMPCLNKIANMIVNGANNPNYTLFGIFGDVRLENKYMLHQWCYTMEEITAVCKEAGFKAVVEEPIYHKKARDMRVICNQEIDA